MSKVGAERDAGGGLVPAQRPEQLRAQVEANLATLGVERIGVVNLRRLDAAPGIVAEGDQVVDIDDQLAELAALRDAGKIGGIGLSSVSAEQLDRAAPVGIACVQNLYSVIDRTAEPVLDRCRELGVAWVPFFPLGSAFANRAQGDRRPDRDGHRGRDRRHSGASRAGLAAVALRRHAADPGHLRSRSPGREHRGRGRSAAAGGVDRGRSTGIAASVRTDS